jgi:rhamnose transport system permease protein
MIRALRSYSAELLLVALIILAAIWSSQLSPYFLDVNNLMNSAAFFVVFGLMAFGLFPIVVQGEIDISLASTLAVASVLFAKLSVSGVPVLVAVPVVLAITAALGAINGLLVAYAGLPSLAVTLGTLGAYRGVAYLLAGDAGVTGLTKDYTFLGMSWIGIVPSTVVLFLLAALVIGVVMETTKFGRYSYAIGANPDASRSASVPVRQVRVGAYAIAGAMAGLAGFIWVNQYQSARGDNADGAILFVLTAVVLGGVSIKGGSGRALGVLLSTLLLATIQTGMKLANVPGTSQTLVIGLLLIASIGGPQLVHLVRTSVLRPRRSAPVGGEAGVRT